MTKMKRISSDAVVRVNANAPTMDDKRHELLKLLYGPRGSSGHIVPLQWLSTEAVIAGQSLLDTGVASLVFQHGEECYAPRRFWNEPSCVRNARESSQNEMIDSEQALAAE